jgi:(4-O-methyl)-D-glucuronate---lignin esterase
MDRTGSNKFLPVGRGYATLIPTSVQADNGADLAEGIIGLANKGQPRKLDDWGALRKTGWHRRTFPLRKGSAGRHGL